MSRHAMTIQPWGEGEYAFRLGLDEIEWLENQHDQSIFELVQSIQDRTAKLVLIRSVLVIGLVGAGMAQTDAAKLVAKNADEMPIEINRDLAFVVGLVGLSRATPEELEETEPGKSIWAKSSALILPKFGWLRPADKSKMLAD